METTFQATFVPWLDCMVHHLFGFLFAIFDRAQISLLHRYIYRKTNNETLKPYTTNKQTVASFARSLTHSDSDLT